MCLCATFFFGAHHFFLVRTILCDEPTSLSYNFEDGILAAAWLQLISDMAQYEQNQI